VSRETRREIATLSVAVNHTLALDGFHGTRFVLTGFYNCEQRKEVMIELASVFHTEAGQGEPPNLSQFSCSHEIQPHGIPISQDERRNHERSAIYRFLTHPLEQGYCPRGTPIPAEHTHTVCRRRKTPRESKVNACESIKGQEPAFHREAASSAKRVV
jgi:hypothetical protein